MTMYFMLYLTKDEEIATKLYVYGDYLRRPDKVRDAMNRLQEAVERDGQKIIGMKPISKRQYKAFIRKYSKPDAEVIKF